MCNHETWNKKWSEEMMSEMHLCNKKQEEMMLRQESHLKSLGVTLIEVNDKLDDMKDQNEILIEQNGDLNEKLDDVQEDLAVVQDKLDISVEDRCPKVKTTNRLEQFVLIKKNSTASLRSGRPTDLFPYYVYVVSKYM